MRCLAMVRCPLARLLPMLSPRLPCLQVEGGKHLFLRPMRDRVEAVRAADPAAAAAADRDLLARKAV